MPRNEMLGIRAFDEASKPKADTPNTTVKPPVEPKPRGRGRKFDWLNQSLLENSPTRPKSTFWDTALSLVIHTAIVATLILIPLIFTNAIDLREYNTTILVAPPPPPPPPPPAAAAQPVVKTTPKPTVKLLDQGKLTAPVVIPKQVAILKEAPEAPPEIGVTGGVPGGIPGGQAGGVIGGILSGTAPSNLPAPEQAMPKAPVRVGGRVSAPKAIFAPEPIYPPLAKQAKVSGEVVIDAVIDAQGRVQEMKVVSGHPLLVPAALAALRQWKYQPTILNDEPTPVKLLVTINFRLQ